MMAGSGNWERSTAGMIYSLSVMVNSTFCMVCMTVPDSVTPARPPAFQTTSMASRAMRGSHRVSAITAALMHCRRVVLFMGSSIKSGTRLPYSRQVSRSVRVHSCVAGCHCGPPVESLPPLTPPCLCVCTVMPFEVKLPPLCVILPLIFPPFVTSISAVFRRFVHSTTGVSSFTLTDACKVAVFMPLALSAPASAS